MKIKCPLLLIMLVISSLVAAQNAAPPFQIKGVLLDSLTQEGEPYATIKIVKKEAPAHALKMLVTDMKGKFQEKVPGTGDFVMTISSIGRNTIVKDFTVKAGEKIVDFGTLYITDASNELGQVEVVAQKPLVKADIDKIEYNVQDDVGACFLSWKTAALLPTPSSTAYSRRTGLRPLIIMVVLACRRCTLAAGSASYTMASCR